jgi:hypothetical protein
MTTSPENKWTKGPWSVSCVRTRWQGNAVLQILGQFPKGDGVVAFLPYSDQTDQLHRECYADARLVAAAPSLYEAVTELLATHPAAYRDPGAIDNRTDNAVKIARAALAKAEGR